MLPLKRSEPPKRSELLSRTTTYCVCVSIHPDPPTSPQEDSGAKMLMPRPLAVPRVITLFVSEPGVSYPLPTSGSLSAAKGQNSALPSSPRWPKVLPTFAFRMHVPNLLVRSISLHHTCTWRCVFLSDLLCYLQNAQLRGNVKS